MKRAVRSDIIRTTIEKDRLIEVGGNLISNDTRIVVPSIATYLCEAFKLMDQSRLEKILDRLAKSSPRRAGIKVTVEVVSEVYK